MIVDLTHTITPDMPVTPGMPSPHISATHTMAQDGMRASLLQLGSHTGTHMDAPSHILRDGCVLDQLPVSQFCGRASVLDVSELPPGSMITVDFLRKHTCMLRSADFVLFYTGWERKWQTPSFWSDPAPALDVAAARYLVCCGLKGVGTDASTVDVPGTIDFPAHRMLLSGGLIIVENLCLRKLLGRRDLMFFALPLKVQDGDGAPVRAVAEFRDFPEEKEMEAP